MFGIVEGLRGVVDIRNKRGGVVCLFETVQGLGCHYFLGQAVLFGDGPGEV